MRTKLTRMVLPLFIALATLFAGEASEAGGLRHNHGNGQGIYPTPYRVPEWVGTTPLMYQPLYPHEFMHKHAHTWRRYTGSRLIPSTTTRALYW